MGKLNESFDFSGSVGNLSVYKMRGVEKPVVRRKGGPSREKVKTGERFEMTRRNNSEFGARAAMSKWILKSLLFHKTLADYNIAGPINSLLKPIQDMDEDNIYGQRALRLTRNPEILKGFSLNRNANFDAIVRTPVEYEFFESQTSVLITIPELKPYVNLFPNEKYPWFSIMVSLGLVPDLFFTQNGAPIDKSYDSFTNPMAASYVHKYTFSDPGYAYFQAAPTSLMTMWHPVKQGMPATTMELELVAEPPNSNHTLILAVGFVYGYQENATHIQAARYAGAAKILGVE
ncbi:hypothetical protein [Paraflavitalea sp. CAU 1676]|uniref:hypothetical protein n=1 Tax=Paraflavitalea sp. CAU 1676 TaxID=3032598 RepID=UPI0023DB8D67|nr:hypothetical protein [Paraflavitalea sp. CAU 1676]MDF2188881.1 hypothetical protein [Paraflavitalea sp. CAU 1676]